VELFGNENKECTPVEYSPVSRAMDLAKDPAWWVNCSPTAEQASELNSLGVGTEANPLGYVRNKSFFRDRKKMDHADPYLKYKSAITPDKTDDELSDLLNRYVGMNPMTLGEQARIWSVYRQALDALRMAEHPVLADYLTKTDTDKYSDHIRDTIHIINRTISYGDKLRYVNIPQENWVVADRITRHSDKKRRTVLFEKTQSGPVYKVTGLKSYEKEIDRHLWEEGFYSHNGDIS
jgi:hypothetical protein